MSQDHKNHNSTSLTLESLELKPEQIKSGEYDHSEVYWLQYTEPQKGQPKCGLFWMFDLKDYLQKNLHVGPEFQICHYGDDPENEQSWKPIFEERFFQRRHEHPESQDVEKRLGQLSDHHGPQEIHHQIYLLVHGQKIGPYAYENIRQQLNEGTILVTDMISLDGGHTWGHLYEIAEFDRRRWDPQHLPHRPDKEHPHHAHKNPNEEEEVSALANLAHIGRTKDRKSHHESQQRDHDSHMSFKKVMTLGVFAFSVLALGVLMWPTDQHVKTATQKNTRPEDVTPHKAEVEKDLPKSDQDTRQPASAEKRPPKKDNSRERETSKNELRVEDSSRNDRFYGTQKEPIQVEPTKIPETEKREFSDNRGGRERDDRRPTSEPRAWGDAIRDDSPGRRENPENDPYYRDDYPNDRYDDPNYDEPGRHPDEVDPSYEAQSRGFEDPYNEEFAPDGGGGPEGYYEEEAAKDYPQDEYDRQDRRDW